MDKEPDRVWELLDEYLCTVRYESVIPLSAWTRARKKLFPKEDDDDEVENYVTQGAELIERAPIILESYHGQDNRALEETRSRWTEIFFAGNSVLLTELHQMMVGLDIWEHAKKTQKISNGRKDYLAISNALFRDKILFFRSEAQKKAIEILTYGGNKRNFDFDDYVNRHLALHNQRAALALRAEEMGLSVHPWLEFEKVSYLL